MTLANYNILIFYFSHFQCILSLKDNVDKVDFSKKKVKVCGNYLQVDFSPFIIK